MFHATSKIDSLTSGVSTAKEDFSSIATSAPLTSTDVMVDVASTRHLTTKLSKQGSTTETTRPSTNKNTKTVTKTTSEPLDGLYKNLIYIGVGAGLFVLVVVVLLIVIIVFCWSVLTFVILKLTFKNLNILSIILSIAFVNLSYNKL